LFLTLALFIGLTVNFVLKDTFYMMQHFADAYDLFLIYLGGNSDWPTRAFVRRFECDPNIESISDLGDMDLGGLIGLASLKYSPDARAPASDKEAFRLQTNKLKWFGVRPSHINRYNLKTSPMSDAEADQIQAILDDNDHTLFLNLNANQIAAYRAELTNMMTNRLTAKNASLTEEILLDDLFYLINHSI